MVKVNGAIQKEVGNVIEGISLIPSVNKMIQAQLESGIDSKKVKKILSKKSNIDILDETECFHFLKVIFEFTNDSKFNPVILTEINNEDNDDEYEIVNGERVRISKDKLPKYYFNFEHKKAFAETYKNENTRRVVMSLFRSTADAEKGKAKDLCNFNIKELEEVFKSFNAKTIRSLQNTISTVERYIAYSQKQKKTDYPINYATAFNSKDRLEKLLDEEADNMIFDKQEIMEMAMNTDNPQDGVIIGLLFDGLSLKNEFEELTNLTEGQCDLDNKVITISEDRKIEISTETAILVRQALEQDQVYLSITGDKARKYKIADGLNVIRGLRGKAKVKGQIINQRILRIKEIFDYKYLTATSVSYSGQIHMAKKLFEKGLNMEEVIEEVLKNFGIPSNASSQFYMRSRIEKFVGLNK